MIYSTGKRKTSIAKVWLTEAEKGTVINEKALAVYFSIANLERKVLLPQAVLREVLEHRSNDSITPESIKQLVSIKGNRIPVSFYDYVNSLSTEAAKLLISSLNAACFKVQVFGGGIKGQAEAVMYGISKCLVQYRPELLKILKDLGFLTRDSRVVERKKVGLRGARKREQYSKR